MGDIKINPQTPSTVTDLCIQLIVLFFLLESTVV